MPGDRTAAIRPSVPPIAWTAMGVWAGVCAAESFSWNAYRHAGDFAVFAPFCLAVATIAAALLLRRRGFVALLLGGLAFGVCVGTLFWADWHADVAALTPDSRKWSAEAVDDPREGPYGATSDARITHPRGWVWSCTWGDDGRPPEAGETVVFFGSPKAPATDEWGRLAHKQGVSGRVSARHAAVQGPARSLRGMVSGWRTLVGDALEPIRGPGGDLLSGVVLGDRRRLAGTPLESDFRTTGLSHLIAVSGGHLVVVAALTGWGLRRLRAGRTITLLVVCMTLGLYVVMSGVQPSAMRAWLMACVVGLAGSGGRRSDGLAALSVAVCVALLSWPPAAFELGLRLSVAAVGGLLLFGRLAERWISAMLPQGLSMLAGPVALTLTAQAATLPLIAPTFGMVSLVSPVANLVAAPLISCALAVGLIGSVVGLVNAAAGQLVLRVAATAGNACAGAASTLASWPHAAVPLSLAAAPAAAVCLSAGALLWLTWPAPRRGVARALAAIGLLWVVWLAVGPVAPSGPELVVLDVGQGDAILVRDDGHAVLIDTGPSPGALRRALNREGVRRLDFVVLTHLHDDHTAGLPALEGVIPVGTVVVPAGTLVHHPNLAHDAERVSDRLEEVSAGHVVAIGETELRVVWPETAVPDAATNEASIVMVISGARFEALLTGDAENEVLQRVVEAGSVGDIDVLKVGHHGSADAVSEDLLRVLRPECALISVGSGNRFGHPVPSTVAELITSGSRVHRTDTGGDLDVRWDDRGWAVRENGSSE